MRVKPLSTFLTLVVMMIFTIIVFAVILKPDRKPVGIPHPYTTFITDNSTATADVFKTPTPSLQLPECSAQPAPTGGFLVFTVWTYRADKELFRADINGANRCQLTNNIVADAQPSISPDGKQIAFVSFDEVVQQSIFIMNSDGTNRRQLTNGGSAYSFPEWSPDGNQLIFQATIDELFDLYIMNGDGSALHKLTNNVTLDIMPDWSSDGRSIVFASDQTFDPAGFVHQSNSYEIYAIDADGSNFRRLTYNERLDRSPTWSPDNQKIAFLSDNRLYVINADGSSLRQLTDSDTYSPVWLPDSRRIAFLTGGTVYTVDIEHSTIEPLTQGITSSEMDIWWP